MIQISASLLSAYCSPRSEHDLMTTNSYLPGRMQSEHIDISTASIPTESAGRAADSAPDTDTGDDSGSVDLSVIIVNYNVREFLEQALRSVERAGMNLSVEVFVVDNNSADGSVEMVRRQFPEVRIIANRENIGFGSANNMALREARGRYALILNPDTIVQEDTFSSLIGFMDDNPDAGAAGCQILNPDGSFARESRRSFPTPDVAFYRITGLSRLFPGSRRFGRYNMTYLPRDEVSEVDALSGSCMMLRMAALSESRSDSLGPEGEGAGLFDESFFMYGEDLDLCFRIQKAGWKIYYYPGTQIIHYKGESTKKGELRYVRLFYGAMLLFTERHLDRSRSRTLIGILRVGIMFRAALSIISNTARKIAAPIIDLAIVYGTVTLLGFVRSIVAGSGLVPLFFLSVAPAYAVGTVAGIGLAGGYRRAAGLPMRPVFTGTTAGFLVVAATAYFVPPIAFSRIVVALSLPISALLLALWRITRSNRHMGPRRAVLVGDADEAARLARMLEAHPQPPFLLDGYVSGRQEANGTDSNGPKRLGRLHHLRDLVRFQNTDDVVFAARDLTNQTIFRTMAELRDLGIQFRMLHEGSEHVIGKAQISHLSLGSLLAQLPEVVVLRSRASRRSFEMIVVGLSILFSPICPLGILLTRRSSKYGILIRKLRYLPAILTGQMALVGLERNHAHLVPDAWNLLPGVFSITNTLQTQELDEDHLTQAYWYYVTHQSSSLDIDIIVRSLRETRNNS